MCVATLNGQTHRTQYLSHVSTAFSRFRADAYKMILIAVVLLGHVEKVVQPGMVTVPLGFEIRLTRTPMRPIPARTCLNTFAVTVKYIAAPDVVRPRIHGLSFAAMLLQLSLHTGLGIGQSVANTK